MIYVLSSDRRATIHWANEQGIPMTKVKHVQNVGSLPGVLTGDGKNRIVKLESYSQRRDHWAIDAKLKNLLRRGQIQIETADQFNQGGALPAGETEVVNETGQDEPIVEVTKEVDSGTFSVGGALPAAAAEHLREKKAGAMEFLAKSSEELNPTDEPAPPKKRVRRTNAQIAYDKAKEAFDADPTSEKLCAEKDAAYRALEKRHPDDARVLAERKRAEEIVANLPKLPPSEDLDF